MSSTVERPVATGTGITTEERAFAVEQTGIEPVQDHERHGRPSEQFWIWCAANISILGVVYGVILVSYGLSAWQALLGGVVGTVVSFALVAAVSLAGKHAGAPTLVISRAAFGRRGNAIPALLSYLSLVGWEIVLVALAVLATEALFVRLGIGGGAGIEVPAFFVVAGVTVAVALLGHATIVIVQKWFTYAFGVLTVVFMALWIPHLDWNGLGDLKSGGWLDAWVPAVSVLAAGLGVGWANAAADYSRYLPRSVSSRSLFGWTLLGCCVAPLVLVSFGVLIAGGGTDLASSSNAIADLAEPLPTWFVAFYLVVAVGGLISGALLDMYSSGLNLLTLGLKVPRSRSVIIDAVLMAIGVTYILFIADDFLGTFQGFLLAIGVPLIAWAGVFVTDLWMRRRTGYVVADLYRTEGGEYGYVRGVNPAALGAFLIATVAGLSLVTNGTFTFLGWWATGVLESSSIGLVLAFVLAAGLYAAFSRGRVSRRVPEPVAAPSR